MSSRGFAGLLIVLLALSPAVAVGQNTGKDVSVELARMFRELTVEIPDAERLVINDSISDIIGAFAASDSVFSYRFDNLRNLGQISSPDKNIRILNWNLVLDSVASRYYCYIIKKNSRGNPNQVFMLSSSYNPGPVKTDMTYDAGNWYGALYYDIRPCRLEGNRYWILLGINYGNPEITRKIIDVLSFDQSGSPVFGKRWFSNGREIKFREVFQYASTGVMTLRFASDKMVVFDHLVPLRGAPKDDPRYYGAEFSYDAYIFRDGIWSLKINVEARNRK